MAELRVTPTPKLGDDPFLCQVSGPMGFRTLNDELTIACWQQLKPTTVRGHRSPRGASY
jgi:hypothetical protein